MDYIKYLLKNKSTTIVDVRSHAEFNAGSIPGAINIPLDEVADRWHEFQEMHKPVVLFCRSGTRSGIAVSLLQQYGIPDLFNGGSIENIQSLMKEYA